MDVGIVGAGFIGTVHSYALKGLVDHGLVDARVTHVHDPDPVKGGNMAGVHGAVPCDDVGSLVDAVDVVWVCTPTRAHLEVVEQAAAAGVAVFCEKPLGRDLDEAEAVGRALQRGSHAVGLVLRSAPVFRALHAAVASGTHGRPMTAVFRDDQSFPVGGIYGSDWRSDVEHAGGGTLLEHSIHDVDLLRWLFGEPQSVAARIGNFAGHPGVEDLASVQLSFPGDVTVTLVSVWHDVQTRPSTRRLEVFCERALLWLDDDNVGPLHVETSDGAETVECPAPEWVASFGLPDQLAKPLGLYAAQAKEFLDSLTAGTPSATAAPGAVDALAAHRVVDAAYRSARHGGNPVEP